MSNISYIKKHDSIIEEFISSNDKIAAKKRSLSNTLTMI